MCLYGRMIINPKYKENKKNGGVIPSITDRRTMLVPIGCGECIECRKKKAREWQIRLLEDIKEHKNGKFITLTFSDQSIAELTKVIDNETTKRGQSERLRGYDLDNEIATLAMRRFLERWRKEYKKSIRHWLVTEIGHNGTENIHLHGIIWTDENLDKVERIWKYGFMWKGKQYRGTNINYVNAQTINYIVKYIYKVDEINKTYKSKMLTSSGIGGNYINGKWGNWTQNIFRGKDTDETYRTDTGHKVSMPIYWRNKIYTEEEREKLWIQKLDKQERWVMGIRIDVSEGEENYYKILREMRAKNFRLGYGNGDHSWDRKQYEKERREILQHKRIIKGSKKASGGPSGEG